MKSLPWMLAIGLFTVAMELSQSSPSAAAEGTRPSSSHDIQYSSPAEALAALRKKQGVTVREENDWYVFGDQAESTIWSIATEKNPAYPTVVKRVLYEENGSVMISMDMLCGADKAICDEVASLFQQNNNENLESAYPKH